MKANLERARAHLHAAEHASWCDQITASATLAIAHAAIAQAEAMERIAKALEEQKETQDNASS